MCKCIHNLKNNVYNRISDFCALCIYLFFYFWSKKITNKTIDIILLGIIIINLVIFQYCSKALEICYTTLFVHFNFNAVSIQLYWINIRLHLKTLLTNYKICYNIVISFIIIITCYINYILVSDRLYQERNDVKTKCLLITNLKTKDFIFKSADKVIIITIINPITKLKNNGYIIKYLFWRFNVT